MNRFFILCVVLAMGVAAATAQAEMMCNGDFEDLTGWGAPGTDDTPNCWTPDTSQGRKNPAAQQSGANAIGGSGTSAYMPAFPADKNGQPNGPRRDMWQIYEANPTGPLWQLEFDLCSEDPGGEADRSLSGAVETGTGDNRITLRIVDLGDDGIGDLQAYTGSWNTIFSNAIEFDPDNDVTTATEALPLAVNHITFTGRSYMPNPVYDVTITNGLAGSPFTATDLAYYRYTPSTSRPVTGCEGINFNTFISAENTGDYLLDNISLVPEPGTALLLTMGILCLAGCRRRN